MTHSAAAYLTTFDSPQWESFRASWPTMSRCSSLRRRHIAADGWKLVHWHASPAPQRATPAPAPRKQARFTREIALSDPESAAARVRAPGPPALLVVTGASGAGKTTLVRALQARGMAGVGCYFFDEIGVPSPEEMERVYGGGAQWQAAATEAWIGRLARNQDGVAAAVLDAQVAPSLVQAALARHPVCHARVVLVDGGYDERNVRLRGPRGQPELATADMDRWAAYLRGQADALGLPVIDTTEQAIEHAVSSLATRVEQLVRQVAAAGAKDDSPA